MSEEGDRASRDVPADGQRREPAREGDNRTRSEHAARIHLRDFDALEPSPALVNDAPEEAALLASGRHHYRVLGEIARGGVGIVLKAHDTELGRDVAIKVLGRRHAKEALVRRRFVEEAQIGGQLQHPGVVPVYELGELDDERPFIAMKLIRGRTLRTLLSERESAQDGRRRLLTIFEAVCQAVAYAHSKGVVHRDLKPDNVLVGAFGEVQVADWGLAKVLDRGGAPPLPGPSAGWSVPSPVGDTEPADGAESGPARSLSGTILGTARYMPPEQANGKVEETDERSDVFSLGAILCELLTGQPPYGGGDGAPVLVQAAIGNLEAARGRIEACQADAELKALARDCLAPEKDRRPRDAGEVARRVQEHLAAADERIHAAELAAAETQGKLTAATRQRQLTIGLATALVLALLSTGAFLRSRTLTRLEQATELQARLDRGNEQALALREKGLLNEALEVARGTAALVQDSRWAGDEQRERAAQLVAGTEVLVREVVELADLERRNARLLAALEELRYDQFQMLMNNQQAELENRYAAAFEAYGAPLDLDDPDPFFEAVRWNGLEVEIAAALDSWAGCVMDEGDWNDPRARILTFLAKDLDPDPGRAAVRSAIIANDVDRLVEFATDAAARGHSAATQYTLLQAIVWHPRFRRTYGPPRLDIVELSAGLYPEDFLMNCLAGVYAFERAKRPDLAIPPLRTASALRPASGRVRLMLAASLSVMGDLFQALEVCESVRALGYEPALVEQEAADALWGLGRFAEAAAGLERAAQAAPDDPTLAVDLEAVRYLAGGSTREQLIETIEARPAPTPDELVAFAEGLLFHPQATQADAERALNACLRVRKETGTTGFNMALNLCKALIELDRVPELVVELDRWEQSLIFPSLYYTAIRSSFRARAFHRLGEPELAKLELLRARRDRDWLVGKAADAWRHSRLVRLVREAEVELGG